MSDAPKDLLAALDMVTAPRAPRAAAVGFVEAAHARYVRSVIEDRNIVAVGISEKVTNRKGTDELSLCFYVERKVPASRLEADRAIPPVLAVPSGAAVFTDVKAIGRVVPEVRRKTRVIQSGFSIGHATKGSAGTLGAIVRRDGKYFVLSNSHVLALEGTARVGDAILYPARLDRGKAPKHRIARLSKWVPFKRGGAFVNRVDAALAEIAPERLEDLDFTILGTGATPGTTRPRRGMTVVKGGRTSGETEGRITDVNFRVVIPYPISGEIGFREQVFCSRYTQPGDSGSVVVDQKSGKIVGLHFAGAAGGSVFNPIAQVIAALRFSFTAG